eukprot:s735_g34.t1
MYTESAGWSWLANVRQCPLRSGAPGPAVPTALWNSRLRSGGAHCDRELAVEVQQCPLRSGAGRSGGLALSSIAANFYAAAETEARQLCRHLSLGASAPPPGTHAGAARLRLAFARVWELQEALLLVALRSCAAGKLHDAWSELWSLRKIARDTARCLSRHLAYAESCKATRGKQRGGVSSGASGEPGGLGARVSLSLALATFSQAMKRRKEVLHSPEAYHAWLQERRHLVYFLGQTLTHSQNTFPCYEEILRIFDSEDLIGRLEVHLDDLSKVNPEKILEGDKEFPEEVCPPTNTKISQGQLLEAAGYTVLHEALGKRAPEHQLPGGSSALSQEEELQLRRDSQTAWRSCVEELQGKLDKKSGGAARLWQQRQECASRIARPGMATANLAEICWGLEPATQFRCDSAKTLASFPSSTGADAGIWGQHGSMDVELATPLEARCFAMLNALNSVASLAAVGHTTFDAMDVHRGAHKTEGSSFGLRGDIMEF